MFVIDATYDEILQQNPQDVNRKTKYFQKEHRNLHITWNIEASENDNRKDDVKDLPPAVSLAKEVSKKTDSKNGK